MKVLAVTNMFPTPDDPHSGRFIQQQIVALRRIGLEVEVLILNRRRQGMRSYAQLPSMVSNAVKRFEPDLVHVMYGGIMSRIVSQVVKQCPVVVTFHGSDLLGQPFERPFRRLFAACGVFASRQAAARCDGIVAVAEHLVQRLPYAIPRSKIRVIPCGINMDLFKPMDRSECHQRLGWSPRAFHVLFQNTGDPVKRPELAEAAVEHLRGLEVRAELHHLRSVAYEEVPVWLNASDALLVTSHHEGSPTIVKEALACNLAVVSVRVGDIPQRVEKIPGCYLSVADPMVLAENLKMVWMNAKRVEARETIYSVSAENCSRALSEFYTDVLHGL
jgi:glycosyltransferase involved in cell wall biosynthesis